MILEPYHLLASTIKQTNARLQVRNMLRKNKEQFQRKHETMISDKNFLCFKQTLSV